MKKLLVTAMMAALAAPAMAEDGWTTDFTSGWRLTVGGAMGGNMRTRLHTRGPKVATPVAASSGSRAAAQAAGDALDVDGSSRVEFPNGAFIDPNDSAGVAGETWNWNVPAGALDDDYTMSFRNSYSATTFAESYNDIRRGDDDYLAGFDVGFDRNLFKMGAFGVDLGFGFAYFRNHDFYRSGGTYYTASSTTSSGSYVTDVSFNREVLGDSWAQNADGSYGAGTYAGPGPVLDLNSGDVTVSHRWDSLASSTSSSSLSVYTKGDYDEIDLTLSVKPYYELTDWFRVQGTLGVEVSRSSAEFETWTSGGYRNHEKFDRWRACGIAGLGGMFSYAHVCLGFDFLARVFDDDLSLHGQNVDGTLERAPWLFRVYAGCEF